MNDRFTVQELHSLFISDIGNYAKDIKNSNKKPLILSLGKPFNRSIRAYIFNCTAPGGRSIDEFKIQLILEGQKRGERGHFELNPDQTILLVGYATPFVDKEEGIWVLFELSKHMDFAYSANIQVYLRQLLRALEEDVYVCQKYNKEILVISRRQYLTKALSTRFEIDLQNLLERAQYVSERF